jgi:hypothetical protein
MKPKVSPILKKYLDLKKGSRSLQAAISRRLKSATTNFNYRMWQGINSAQKYPKIKMPSTGPTVIGL